VGPKWVLFGSYCSNLRGGMWKAEALRTLCYLSLLLAASAKIPRVSRNMDVQVESRPREARPEDSSYIYIYIYMNLCPI